MVLEYRSLVVMMTTDYKNNMGFNFSNATKYNAVERYKNTTEGGEKDKDKAKWFHLIFNTIRHERKSICIELRQFRYTLQRLFQPTPKEE